MILGLVIGFGVGLNVGLWGGTYLYKKAFRPVLDGYKADTEKWFQDYLKMLGWYQEMRKMYIDEVIKNIGK